MVFRRPEASFSLYGQDRRGVVSLRLNYIYIYEVCKRNYYVAVLLKVAYQDAFQEAPLFLPATFGDLAF